MDNSTLTHHGILGQKWGVRRYQNKDGSLTNLGKRRLGTTNSGKATDAEMDKIHGYVAREKNAMATGMNQASQIATRGSSMASRLAADNRKKEAEKIDLSDVSNKDLQDAVNRMNLERQYRMLTTENISTGRDKVANILSYAGDILAIGSSAAAIAMAIHTIKSDK